MQLGLENFNRNLDLPDSEIKGADPRKMAQKYIPEDKNNTASLDNERILILHKIAEEFSKLRKTIEYSNEIQIV